MSKVLFAILSADGVGGELKPNSQHLSLAAVALELGTCLFAARSICEIVNHGGQNIRVLISQWPLVGSGPSRERCFFFY